MRWIACTIVISLAACGGSGEGNKAATKAASLAAGQWELTSEAAAGSDSAAPANGQAAAPAVESVCVGSGRPPTEMFSGAGYDCSYDNYYARNGRLNMTMNCRRDGSDVMLSGSATGEFGTDSIEYERDIRNTLPGQDRVRIAARVTGRRTGDCSPEAAAGNSSAGNASADAPD